MNMRKRNTSKPAVSFMICTRRVLNSQCSLLSSTWSDRIDSDYPVARFHGLLSKSKCQLPAFHYFSHLALYQFEQQLAAKVSCRCKLKKPHHPAYSHAHQFARCHWCCLMSPSLIPNNNTSKTSNIKTICLRMSAVVESLSIILYQ